MKRTLLKLALVGLAAFALAGCETNPAKPEPVATAPATKKTLVEMEFELRMKEIDAQTQREERAQKAAIKFAAESKSEFAQGFVAATLVSGQKQAAAEPQRRSLLDAVNQEADRELRRAELEERNSWWNRGLQVTDRVLNYKFFSKGLEQERYRIDQSNSQQRYMLSTLRGAQYDGFTAGSGATLNGVNAGHSTTLGGMSAGAAAAAAGASAALRSQAGTAAETTPAE